MTPAISQGNSSSAPKALSSEDVCITGVAGAFPDSDCVVDLAENLFNKVDLVSEDDRRWTHAHTEIPIRTGKINGLKKFDANFFDMKYKETQTMDPMHRILLEKTYECILDAGMNPEELRNTKTGVFVGCLLSESEAQIIYEDMQINDHGLTGNQRFMAPHRISEWLELKGPSYNTDTACSSSLFAFENAFKSIQEGECDAAFVGGCNLCLHPTTSLIFARLGVLSYDGKCKSFDERANGYARSESIAVCLLQRAKDARRIYCKVVYAKTNCDGFKSQGINYPAARVQKRLFEDFYEECGVDPATVEFLEAHATGTNVGDPEEASAITDVFCKNRKGPLLIGSIKSNLGHGEGSSGLNSVAKGCIAYNTGYIPPNINFEIPRKEIPGLHNGQLKVITEKTTWNRGYLAMSCFGFGGANAHILMQNVSKPKVNNGLPADTLPRLVCLSGQSEARIVKTLIDLESRTVDVDEVALWHSIYRTPIKGSTYRGYVLLGSTPNRSVPLGRGCQFNNCSDVKVCFKYSSLQSSWRSIAAQLMDITIFASSIHRSSSTLESVGFNLLHVINKTGIEYKYSIVGTVALNVALTDLLTTIGIKPNYVIGEDIGVLCSAYADGSLTAAQTIRAAYEINKAVDNVFDHTPAKNFKQVNELLNSKPNKELLKNLKDIVSEPKRRSERWLSTNARADELVTAEHLIRCIANPASSDRCSDAVVINISADEDWQGIPLVKEDTNNIQFLFIALGKLYLEGLNQDLAKLYPPVSFPVALGTPMLSHLVGCWDHGDNWKVTDSKVDPLCRMLISESIVKINLADEDKEFITGHVIDGRVLYPGTGYLVLVWNTFSMLKKREAGNLSVIFEDIYLMRATNIPKSGIVDFNIAIQMESGRFEITENNITVVTGRILEAKKVGKEFRAIPDSKTKTTAKYDKLMSSKDFYKELNIRGYQYKGLFRGVHSCNIHGTDGNIFWKDNWVTFLDNMLQVQIVGNDSRSLYVPTRIEKVSIDVELQKEVVNRETCTKDPNAEVVLPFNAYPNMRVIRCGGAEIRRLHITAISKKPPLGIPVHEKNIFVPNHVATMQVQDAIRTDVQIILENIQVYRCKVIELVDDLYNSNNLQPIIETVGNVLADLPLVQSELLVLSESQYDFEANVTVANKKPSSESNAMLFIGANLLNRPDVLEEGVKTLKPKCYILSREITRPTSTACPDGYNIITVLGVGSEYLVLFKEKVKPPNTKYIEISTKDKSYSWIEKVKSEINNGSTIGLYSQNEPINGLLGLVNCLRKEAGGENISGILIADPTAPKFDPTLNFYKNQVDLGLGVNVYQKGQWGTYRHLLIANGQDVPVIHAYIKPTAYGDMSSLRFQEGPLCIDADLQSDSNNIHVYCSALNFRDIMTAMGRVTVESVAQGRINQECVQGIEMSGKLNDGTRVMAIGGRGITNLADMNEALVWRIPDEWSFTEAASVPVAYSTVYMAMVLMGRIKKAESILIHAGTGAVGQAAINVALAYGLEVFTTVGTPAKRAFIKRIYPQIDDDHIGNSRDISFEQLIRRVTNGKGVDLVLNSLADEKLQASVKCLKPGGRFLEIGKYDITTNTQIQTCFLNKGLSFFGVMLDFNDDAHDIRKKLIQLVETGIRTGVVRPITYCTFEKNEIEKAFRYMAAGKHIGKVVIKIRDEEPDRSVVTKPTYYPIKAIPRYMCNKEYVYVFVGGLGGFGLELADWVVMRGGRKLVFSSRRGVSNGYQALRLKFWQEYGAQIEVSTADVTTESGCEELLSLAASMGPVRAIFNLAVILKDAIFSNQTPETFQTSFNPKAQATIHLDKVSRKLCPQLKDFVIFSSVSCGRGNAGQTNYGFSNSVMERICEQRRQEGLPAIAIQWGAIGDVGLVADMQEENIQLEIGGTLQQRISSCLESLDVFMKQDAAIVSSIVVAEKRAGGGGSNNVVDVVANILGITDMKTISRQVALSELGMDSVMAVEIKQTLERDFEIFLNAQEIRILTFAKLIELASQAETPETQQTKQNNDTNTTDYAKIVYTNLGDESTVEEEYLCVPSLATTLQEESNNMSNVLADEVLLLLPGIESCAEALKVMCSKLKIKTIVMQLGTTTKSMDDMVDRLYKVIKVKLAPGGTFHLLGYSFGAIPILEVTAKLEKEGYKGIVICVDGAPSYTIQLAKETFDPENLKEVDVKVLLSMFNVVSASIPGIMDTLNEVDTLEDKIKILLGLLPFKLNYSIEFLHLMTLAIITRVKAMFGYNEANMKKISSPIVLIRQKLATTLNCNEYYGLDHVTENTVNVHYLEYSHKDIVDSVECANIINDTLEQFVLTRGKKATPNVPIKERRPGTI